jgi:hypothetical protein
MWGEQMHAEFRQGNMKEKCRWEDLQVVGRIRLKWIMKHHRPWTGFIWLRACTRGRALCGHRNGPPGST